MIARSALAPFRRSLARGDRSHLVASAAHGWHATLDGGSHARAPLALERGRRQSLRRAPRNGLQGSSRRLCGINPTLPREYDYTSLLTLAAKAGLRLGECLGLDWTDCDLVKGKGTIHVRQQWTRLRELRPPKAGSRRDVPIPDELVRLLLELKMKAVDKTGPVFASRTGGRLAHRNVERRGFDPAASDAGLEGVTFHDLRHAYGLRLASKGLTARPIADAMGHKKTATTEIYIQRFNGDQVDEKIRLAMTG